jgi:hypothetical protein
MRGTLPENYPAPVISHGAMLVRSGQRLARLVFSRVGRESGSEGEWCLTGGGRLVPGEHIRGDRREICVIHVYAPPGPCLPLTLMTLSLSVPTSSTPLIFTRDAFPVSTLCYTMDLRLLLDM